MVAPRSDRLETGGGRERARPAGRYVDGEDARLRLLGRNL
jgi:hypothetical protein